MGRCRHLDVKVVQEGKRTIATCQKCGAQRIGQFVWRRWSVPDIRILPEKLTNRN